MLETVKMIIWVSLKLLAIGLAGLYAGLVLMAYRMDGPNYPLRINGRDPARATEHFLIWLGARAVALLARVGRQTLEVLFDASAQVGEWYGRRRGVDAHSIFHLRFP